MTTCKKKVKYFQIAEVLPQRFAQILVDFFPISHGAVYKSVAYIKKKALKAYIW